MVATPANAVSRLLPRNWMRLSVIELKSISRELEEERARWQEDRQILAKQGLTDNYKDVQNVIADYNVAINALKAIVKQKVEGETMLV